MVFGAGASTASGVFEPDPEVGKKRSPRHIEGGIGKGWAREP